MWIIIKRPLQLILLVIVKLSKLVVNSKIFVMIHLIMQVSMQKKRKHCFIVRRNTENRITQTVPKLLALHVTS